MRKLILVTVFSGGLAACNSSGISGRTADSLKLELDTSLGKIKDSVKAKGERTLDAVKEKWNDLKAKEEKTKDSTW